MNGIEWFRVREGAIAAGAVLVGVLILALLSRWTATERNRQHPAVLSGAQALVREAARNAYTAEHATHPLLRLIHANYAVATLNAASKLAKESELERATRTNVHELKMYAEKLQNQQVQEVGERSAELQLEGPLASAAGWLVP